MATQKKISALTVLSSRPSVAAVIPVVQGGVTYQVTRNLFLGTTEVNVNDYGAVGDGVTDDSAAIQLAANAVIAAGGGTLLFPAGYTYKIATTISVDPITLTSMMKIIGYGAKINYTGASDCFVIKTNIAATDNQHAERSVHMEGMHIVGTSSATSAIRVKATFCTFRTIVIEDFTKITSQCAAIILDGLFHFWVEECHFDGVDIRNTGNGICFISRDESGGTPASLENNFFTNFHVWCTVAGGKGFYGVGLGASTICLMSRSVWSGVIVHITNVANVVAWDFTLCSVEGCVLISPSIDVFGTAATSAGFKYTYASVLTILGPTNYPNGTVTNFFTGGGKFFVIGTGNNTSTLTADSVGNLTVPSLTNTGNYFDANGKTAIGITATANAVNYINLTNNATAAWPIIAPAGTDNNIGMYLIPKGTGQIFIADQNFQKMLIFSAGVASAVNYLQITNAATGTRPTLAAKGTDGSVDLALQPQGSAGGVALLDGSSNLVFITAAVATPVNYIQVTNAATGNPAIVEATGLDGTVGLNLKTKSTGEIQFNGTPVSGAWQTWSPSWVNWSIGNGTVTAKYKQVGKLIFCRLRVDWGSSTSITGADPTFTLPVTAISGVYIPFHSIGGGGASPDNTGSGSAILSVNIRTTTTASINAILASGTYATSASLSNTIPVAHVAGSVDTCEFFYEAA